MSVHPLAEQVQRLHARGVGRNAMARQLDVSTRQIDNVAAELGLTFDRDTTRAAVEALIVDAQHEREVLGADFRRAARIVLDKLFGSTDLEPSEVRELIQAASAAASADARLGRLQIEAQKNRVQGTPDSKAAADFGELLGTLRQGMSVIQDDLDEVDEDDYRQQIADESGEPFEGVEPSSWQDDDEDQD